VSDAVPENPKTDVAATLIRQLETAGEHVDEGSFTLDPSKAFEKLRSFQLAEREAWVLLLVEAAALAGDRARIAVWTGEDIVVELVGPVLSAKQLESVFLAPFADQSALEGEARVEAEFRRLLALALNAALAIESASVEVEAVAPDGQAHRMGLGATGSPRVEPISTARSGIVVRRRGEGMVGQQQSAREADLVRERCRHAVFPVLCDGVRISGGPEAILEGGPQVAINDAVGKTIGVATLSQSPSTGHAFIVVRGVLVETYRAEAGWRKDLCAVVVADHLRTDLSASQVVRNADFEAVIAAIDDANGQLRSFRALARKSEADVAPSEPVVGVSVIQLVYGIIFLLVLFAAFVAL
jgi:hypothetical protein